MNGNLKEHLRNHCKTLSAQIIRIRILRSFQYWIKVLVTQKIQMYLNESTSLQNVSMISIFALICFVILLPRHDFLIRTCGLKTSSLIPAQNVKLILRSFGK